MRPSLVSVVVAPPVDPVTLAEAWAWLRLDPTPAIEADPDAVPPVEAVPAHHPDDAMLTALISTATKQCEQETRRAFVQRTLAAELHDFWGPASKAAIWDAPWPGWGFDHRWRDFDLFLDLPLPPFVEFVSLAYFPADWDPDADPLADPTPIDAAQYRVITARITDGVNARVRLVDGFAAPALYADNVRPVVATWKAGWPPAVVTAAAPDADPPVAEVLDYRGNVPQGIKTAVLTRVQLLYDEITPEKRVALEDQVAALLRSYTVPLA